MSARLPLETNARGLQFAMLCGDRKSGKANVFELVQASRASMTCPCRARSQCFSRAGRPPRTPASGLEDMRRGTELLREQNVLLFDGLLKIALAEAEARAGDFDRSVAILDEALATCERTSCRTYEAELHRARGEILLKRDPANPAPAEEAFLTAIAVAKQQGTRSFELRAALSLAKLHQSTDRPVEAYAVLTPALDGFAPTSQMPEIAEAQALLAELSQTAEVKEAVARRQRLTQLHAAYGNALFSSRGPGAPETAKAFATARNTAIGDTNAPDRLAVDYALWAGSLVRGELSAMRATAATFLSDVEARPDSPEAGVACRAAGMNCWFAGDYHEARDYLEQALSLFRPGRDDDLAFRFGIDAGVSAMLSLAIASWPLGDVDRASSLVESAQARLSAVTHVGALAFGRQHSAVFELMRRNRMRGAQNAFELARLAREHDLTFNRAFAVFLEGWATAAGGGLEDMRRGVDLLREQNVLLYDGLLKVALAEAEAAAGDSGRAVVILDEALSTCGRTGYRAFEAELHRVRGEILLARNPANPSPAEEALLTAIAVAKQQGTRSFELRAALALATLYQSTTRPVEAHSVLASALDGFSPTPEMSEIAQAQALLAALAETEEVKTIVTQHERRLRLQTDYGRAVMYSRGFAAAETKSAFARAMELAARTDDFSARFSAFDGQCRSAIVRGELRSAWELASSFLREAEESERLPETAAARRSLGLIAYFLGDFVAARAHLEQALHECDTEHGEEAWERFGDDTGAVAMSYLALTTWQLGEVERARELIDTANQRAAKIGHGPSKAIPLYWMSYLEILRGDPKAALCTAEALVALAQAHAMTHFSNMAELNIAWAHGRLTDPTVGRSEFQQAFKAHLDQGFRIGAGFYTGLLAELEAETLGAERGLARIDEALLLADQVEYRCDLAFLHRLRGEILLRVDPSKPAPAEEAFQTAVAVAKQQGARSLSLRAALSLANMYQSTARPADAHAILAPALEGFAPTDEMPEIAEAQTLLAALAEMEEVKAAVAQRKRRLHLQTAYGHAMMWSTGFASEETKAAFARATELATGSDNSLDRLVAAHGQWVLATVRGELRATRGLALTFLREAEGAGRIMEACVVHRSLALISYFSGDFAEAGSHCEQALAACEPEWDLEVLERFGDGISAVAMSFLALTAWQLGDVERARELIESANRCAAEFGHGPSMTTPLYWKSYFEILRGDASAALTAAEALEAISRDQGMSFWGVMSKLNAGWARGRINNATAGAAELQQGLTAYASHGARLATGFYTGLLAELEAETLGAESALSRIDEALALALQVDHRSDLAFLHRLRGEILLKRDPNNPASAEEAFQTALAVARQQGARSHGLKTALALAKLYQSTNRLVDAQAVLSPALEGFSPTPEMPEIAEARALLAVIEAAAHMRHE